MIYVLNASQLAFKAVPYKLYLVYFNPVPAKNIWLVGEVNFGIRAFIYLAVDD